VALAWPGAVPVPQGILAVAVQEKPVAERAGDASTSSSGAPCGGGQLQEIGNMFLLVPGHRGDCGRRGCVFCTTEREYEPEGVLTVQVKAVEALHEVKIAFVQTSERG
jgi:hypothetical protein